MVIRKALAVGGREPGKSQIFNLQFSIFNAFAAMSQIRERVRNLLERSSRP
jgi:hypothetical protein